MKKYLGKKFLIIGIVAFVVLIIAGGLFYTMSYKPKMLCQEAIKEQLKSPASAEFSDFQKIDKNRFLYTVDSQNGFGAMIRNKRLCLTIGDKISCDIAPKGFSKERRMKEQEEIKNFKNISYDVDNDTICEGYKKLKKSGIVSKEKTEAVCKSKVGNMTVKEAEKYFEKHPNEGKEFEEMLDEKNISDKYTKKEENLDNLIDDLDKTLEGVDKILEE